MVELTTWAQLYLIAHKQEFRFKSKTTVQAKRVEQRKPSKSKRNARTPEVATVLQMSRLWPQTIGMSEQSQSQQGTDGIDIC